MFGIGETEFAIILLFAFLLFGPDKLPSMGRTIGRALRQFREAQEGFTKVVQTEIVDPINKAADEPSKVAEKKAAADDDADAEVPKAKAAPKKAESFAERRARLAAEKAAAPAEAEAASTEATPDVAVDASPVGEATPTVTPVADDVPAKPKKPSVASLYGLDTPKEKPATTRKEEGKKEA